VLALSIAISRKGNFHPRNENGFINGKPLAVSSVDVRDFLDPFPPMIDRVFD
jgi:hypothetical protein